jgi:hypothetical protein
VYGILSKAAGNGIGHFVQASQLVLLRIGCKIKRSVPFPNEIFGGMSAQCGIVQKGVHHGQSGPQYLRISIAMYAPVGKAGKEMEIFNYCSG